MTKEESQLLLARLDERYNALNQKLDAILVQCVKTNGRVSKSEEDIHQLFNWKSEMHGGWKVTTALGAVVGAISAFIGNKMFGN